MLMPNKGIMVLELFEPENLRCSGFEQRSQAIVGSNATNVHRYSRREVVALKRKGCSANRNVNHGIEIRCQAGVDPFHCFADALPIRRAIMARFSFLSMNVTEAGAQIRSLGDNVL
ncbi:hypothetical protein D3C80_1509550 [compost metagenome]